MKGLEKKQRAVLQARAWKTGEMFKLQNVELPAGTWVHFDIETNPLTPGGADHVYLWGFLKPDYTKDNFEYVWTDTHEDDDSGSQWSVAQYVLFLRERDPVVKQAIKNSILAYNRDDVIATRKLEEWLKSLNDQSKAPFL